MDIAFERVKWLGLPAAFESIHLTLATDDDAIWPNVVLGQADKRSPLRLAISSVGSLGLVICARVEVALTSWRPGGISAGVDVEEIVWSLGKT